MFIVVVQLKGNLIPEHVLQVEYCWVKVRLMLERVPITFVPTSGKLSGMYTCECYTHLNELLNETYNINSIYTMNLRILSLYILIGP